MGRIRTKQYAQFMPSGMRLRTQRSGKKYFYLDIGGAPRREIPLGSVYEIALQKRSELLAPTQSQLPTTISFDWLSQQYVRQIVSNKDPKQQRQDLQAINSLHNAFGCLAVHDFSSIQQSAIESCLLSFSAFDGVRNQYAKSVLQHMCKWAIERQYLNQWQLPSFLSYPKAGILRERAAYMVDELLNNLLVHCDPHIRFAFRLIRLTRARRADVLSIGHDDVKDGILYLNRIGSSDRQELPLHDANGKPNSLGLLIVEMHQFRLQLRPAIKSEQQAPHLYLLSDALGRPLLDADLKEAFAIARTASVKKLIVDKRLDIAKEIQAFQLNELSPLR
jgi:hypothetical protein